MVCGCHRIDRQLGGLEDSVVTCTKPLICASRVSRDVRRALGADTEAIKLRYRLRTFIAVAKLKSFTQAGSRMAHGTQSASDTRAILQYIDTVLLDVHARCSRPQ